VIAAALQLGSWCTAFWLALWLHARRDRARSARFALALLAGALLARAGDALLWGEPGHWLEPQQSVSVLFVPLGLLLLAPQPAAFASLPLPLALARLGCLAAGCCRGASGEPLPLFEAAALGALHLGVARGADDLAPARFALGFGALRLAQSPWRPPPPRASAELVTPELVALAWMLLGALWWLGRAQRRVTNPGRNAHASATSRRGR
jgi:hypothetical protein